MKKNIWSNKTIWSFFWFFLKEKKWGFIVFIQAPIVFALGMNFQPYLLKVLIDRVVSFQSTTTIFSIIAIPLIGIVFFELLLNFSWRLFEWVMIKTVPSIKASIRSYMFNYLQAHSYRYFQDQLVGELSNKVMDMVRGFENLFIIFFHAFIPCFLMNVVSLILMTKICFVFPLSFFLWFVVFVLVSAILSFRCVHLSDQHSQAGSEVSGKLVDSFKNMSIVRLFSRHLFENRYLERFQRNEVSKAEALGRYMLLIHLFQGLTCSFLFLQAVLLFLFCWERGWVTVGDFTYIMTITYSLIMMNWWMSEQFVLFFKELGVCRQSFSLLAHSYEVKEVLGAKPLQVKKGEIAFKDVTFYYVPFQNLFSDKNITIHPGEKVGLVGFSGSGKTTFAHLILRYFDPLKGKILIDGQDISTVTFDSLRREIAMIPQDTTLFHRALKENIHYGCQDATEEEIFEASKKACCHEFISELEDGYETVVGEGGMKLSGGQRQRIAIARAFLRKGSIVILDEATSALDSVTERKIQKSLLELMEGKTAIVIAHRLSTLFYMDRILVFHEGVIVEEGTHEELIRKKGHYFHLWSLQVDGFLPHKEKIVEE